MALTKTVAGQYKAWASHMEIVGGPDGPWDLRAYVYWYPYDEDTGDFLRDLDENGSPIPLPATDGDSRHAVKSETITIEDLEDARTLANGKVVTKADVMEFLALEVDALFHGEDSV